MRRGILSLCTVAAIVWITVAVQAQDAGPQGQPTQPPPTQIAQGEGAPQAAEGFGDSEGGLN